MKKLITILLIFSLPICMQAQNYILPNGNGFPQEFVHIPATLLAMYVIILFIMTLVKSVMDYRLKSKMIDKGVPDEVVKQFLQPNQRDLRNQAVKLSLLMAGLGFGFTLVALFLPFGFHSVAIIAFCLSGSFLGYYMFINRPSNRN